MPKAFYKHKLLFDENMLPRQRFPRLNSRFIVITINRDDFAKLVGAKDDCGVIAVPDGPAATQTDTKLTALLMQHGPNYFRGRFRSLGAIEAKRQAA
jgi:hypothetical protein